MSERGRWSRVEAVYHAARERDVRERAAFLDAACEGDEDLRREVESLLGQPADDGFLSALAGEVAAEVFQDSPSDPHSNPGSDDGALPSLPSASRTSSDASAGTGAQPRLAPGQVFGPYRIVRLLGRGGMGEVYEADQLDHGRRVALKVLSERLTDPRDRARFLREGQLAASINHPHSVYIFGSEEIAGTPVIAMELLAGGTLRDRVGEEGPLPPARAVDAILQVVAGLDAAHAGGILHRDVKPANCFIDRDGTVKVGDFGLSISTMARDVTRLTKSGTFHGTLQFAAPEQLKGEPLDVRADIYAVGATLHYLLTGQPPFDDADLLTLLTRIATEAPRSPRESMPAVPRRLAAIVLECLAKDPAARIATYRALTEALRPFDSTTPTAATIGSRFAAGAIDQIFLLFFLSANGTFLRVTSGDLMARPSTLQAMLCVGIYFTLTEGLTGASIGKWIFGLRVTDEEGAGPRLVRTTVRSAIFTLAVRWPYMIPTSLWIRAFAPDGRFDPGARGALLSSLGMLFQFAPLVLFLTARSRHGFAGIHDLVSGTRVTARAREARQVASPNVRPELARRAAPSGAGAPGLPARGPLRLLELLRSTASAPLWLGFDPVLKRKVWIRDTPVGTPLSDAARRDVARPGRLRWLAGQQGPNGSWEAFEAPPGAPLLSLAATPQPWGAVRHWLADLAEELTCCHLDGHLPELALDRVWITTEGRVKLLDFPAPDTEPHHTAAIIADTGSTAALRIQSFLDRVAVCALFGCRQGAENALPIVQPPLPPSGTALLRALHQTEAGRPEDHLELCRRALTTPMAVPRWSRALLPALLATVLCVYTFSFVALSYSTEFGGGAPVFGVGTDDQALFNSLIAIERLRRSGAPASDPERQAIEIYVAGRYAPLAARPSSFIGGLRPFRQLASDIAARRPVVSDADLLAALEQLGPARLDDLNREPAERASPLVLHLAVALLPVLVGLGYVSLLSAFVFRGGLILRLFGVALVDSTGAEVSRWRALWRACLAWMPLIVLQLLADYASLTLGMYPTVEWAVVASLWLLVGVGTAWAIAIPARGLHDRIAGTWLVPK